MRKLMWFTVGFGAACCYCAYTWTNENLILPGILFCLLAGLCLYAGNQMPKLKIAAVIGIGISLGLLWFQGYNSFYLEPISRLDGKKADVTVNCTDYSYSTDFGTAVEGYLLVNGKICRGKFYVSGDVEMEPGDVLSGCFELRTTTQDSENGATYHQGKGIFLLGYQEDDASLLKVEDVPIWAYPAMFRQKLVGIIDFCFPEDVRGFARAILFGDRSGIDYELNTAFKLSGIMHIIAVSGLHVTILFTLINLVFLKRRWLVAVFGIPALVLFAAMAGFTPSITRACIMQCLIIGATVLNRDYDGPTELAFASLVMLVINPIVITSVSFQLSVGCMIGIFLFQKRIYDWICGKIHCTKGTKLLRVKRWLAGSISVTLSAISLTTPLSAYYFGAVSLVGVLTNLLTLWAVTLIFYGILLVCFCGFALPGISAAIASAVSWLIRYVIFAAQNLASFPLAAVYTRSVYIVAWLVFCYVLVTVFVASFGKRPGLLLLCSTFGLVLCITASLMEPRLDQCRITVLDVGQGQSIIFQSDGRTYLVDCGGSYDDDAADIAAETLLSQGVRNIDGLILTHFDRDHAGGVRNLLSRIPTDTVYAPLFEDSSIPREIFGIHHSITQVDSQVEFFFGSTKFTLYPPIVPDSSNEGSLAVLFQRENCDILITGDRSALGERLLLKESVLPKLDILVAGHHGSKDATCEELLAATNPEIVVISVGRNSYGHPATETLERIESFGCMVYRTDSDGTIIFRR